MCYITADFLDFGSEWFLLKGVMEANMALCYKFRVMVVSIDGPTFFVSDNKCVVINAPIPESTLKKRQN